MQKSSSQQSTYEDYNDTSRYYDSMRVAVGLDIIVQQLEDPESAVILDAGAGTGNYTFELCKKVRKIVALEVNEGQISQMQKKLKEGDVKNVEIIKGSLTGDLNEISEFQNKFDLITINLVVHHLDTNNEEFPQLNKVLKNLNQFLKPKGKICINHFLQDNLKAIWQYQILSECKGALQHFKRFAPRDAFKQAYKHAGFQNYKEVKCTEPIFGLRHYDCYAPFTERGRKTSSFFADLKEGQNTEEYCKKLKKMMENGTFPDFLAKTEQIKQAKGLSTFIIGQKIN